MPMKTFKKNKNNKKPQLRVNVKKGTSNYIYNRDMKQDSGNKQRWEALREKYEYKGNDYEKENKEIDT